MTQFKTPDKVQCRLQPGHVAVHSKWRTSIIVKSLRDLFIQVHIVDIGAVDFCLPDATIIYLSDIQLCDDEHFAEISSLSINFIIADRNTATVEKFTKLQETLSRAEKSIMPVGHIGEVALLIHQIHLASCVSSPGHNFEFTAKAPPDIQMTLLQSVPGLGATKAKKLLNAFRTVQKIGLATSEQLVPVVGKISAINVIKFFQYDTTS